MAQLGNLLVTGVSRLLSKLYVNDSVTAPTFIGKLQGNADSATSSTKATQDSAGQQINTTYIKGLSVNGKTVTYTKGDGTTGTITTQDTNTWRPLGTGADQSCAGNDSRLSNARPASDVYAWAKESTKPAYTWNEIGSKPSTFTPASHGHNMISMYASNTINSIKNDTTTKWGSYNDSIHFYNNSNQLTDQPSQYGFLHNISNSSAEVHQVWYEQASGSVYHRGGNSSGWSGSWKRFLDTGNYNSYVPTKTGGGASGTWGINITGKATTAGTADVANSVAWGNVSGKPSTYTPSSHTHDDRYYTETEINNKLGDLSSLSSYGSDVASILKAIIAKLPETYSGSYSVTPSATAQSLSTSGKVMKQNVSVSAIPYKEESNTSGTTVTIG